MWQSWDWNIVPIVFDSKYSNYIVFDSKCMLLTTTFNFFLSLSNIPTNLTSIGNSGIDMAYMPDWVFLFS